jgi:hypothetical protein
MLRPDEPQDVCTVCAEAIDGSLESVATIECGHVFHTACVVEWFRFHNASCPNCRSERAATDEEVPEVRVSKMRRRARLMPPWIQTQLATLGRVEAREKALRRERRALRREHAPVFKRDRALARREDRVRSRRSELVHRLGTAVAPGVPLLCGLDDSAEEESE